MGAVFNFARFQGVKEGVGPTPVPISSEDLRNQVCDMIEDAKYDYGHAGYSGTWAEADGCKTIPMQFDDWEKARKFLEDHAEKWGPALGVRVITGNAKTTGWAVGAWCSS